MGTEYSIHMVNQNFDLKRALRISLTGDLGQADMDGFCEHNDGIDAGDDNATHDTLHVHATTEIDSDYESPHPDMSKWMLVCNTDSEGDADVLVSEEAFGKNCTRVRALESQPEYQKLKELGLAIRPDGCTLGIHPAAHVWRSAIVGSTWFSRSFTKSAGRNSWQALLRVVELMLESFLELNPKDKLAKHQLARIKKIRSEEPPHKD